MKPPLLLLSLGQVEEYMGREPRSFSKVKLPPPDAIIGPINEDGSPARGAVRGWFVETIDAWAAERPGPGRPRKAT